MRSLARQKGKAQRYEELRSRRLAVEVEVVRSDLDTLETRLGEVTRELSGSETTEPGMTAQLSVAESTLEAARLRHLEAQRARVDVAGRLESVRAELAEVEKELAVSQERIGYAERRGEQIARERGPSSKSWNGRSGADRGEASDKLAAAEGALAEIGAQLADREAASEEARTRLGEARRQLSEGEDEARETLKRIAQLEGDREGAELQVEELTRRYGRIEAGDREGRRCDQRPAVPG